MKTLLTQAHLNELGVNDQPKAFQEKIKHKYQKSLDGDIDFFDILWVPVIYSHKSQSYFEIQENGELVSISTPSNDDLEPLTENRFNDRFGISTEKYKEIFSKKAIIENQLQLILSPENTEKYFLQLLQKFSPEDTDRILQAISLCKESHEWQMRDERIEYYWHPIFVAIKWIEYDSSADDIIVLLLHDTIEDTPLTYDDIKEKFW